MLEINKEFLKITVPLPPSVNHIYLKSKNGGMYLNEKGAKYKELVSFCIKKEALKQKWEKALKEEYCYLDAVVYMDKKARDADNLYKLIQDSITMSGAVWEDDTYALNRTQRIYIDKNNPRVEITISKTETVGIFDSKEEFDEFNRRCKGCNMGSRNCGVKKLILENRIINKVERIDGKWVCLKKKKRGQRIQKKSY